MLGNNEIKKSNAFLTLLDRLYHGGIKIESVSDSFIRIRPDEKPEEYQYRLSHFVYTNIIGDAIRDVISRVCRAPYSLSDNYPPDLNFDVLRSASEILSRTMRHGEVWYLASNRGIDFLDPLTIVDYEFDPTETDQTLLWLKTESEQNNGSKTQRTEVTYRVDSIAKLITLDGEVVERSDTPHNLGRCPVRVLKEPSLWVMHHGYLKALQYLSIENSHTLEAIDSDQFQRLFKPSAFLVEGPDGYIDEDQRAALSNVRSNNKNLLIGDDFKFAERSSSSLEATRTTLDRIERQIRDIVSYGGVYETAGTQASGRSKDAEFELALDQMSAYGARVVYVLNWCLADLADILGLLKAPTVSGFSSFTLESGNKRNLVTLIEAAERIAKLPPEYISPIALASFLERLNTTMALTQNQAIIEKIAFTTNEVE